MFSQHNTSSCQQTTPAMESSISNPSPASVHRIFPVCPRMVMPVVAAQPRMISMIPLQYSTPSFASSLSSNVVNNSVSDRVSETNVKKQVASEKAKQEKDESQRKANVSGSRSRYKVFLLLCFLRIVKLNLQTNKSLICLLLFYTATLQPSKSWVQVCIRKLLYGH